MNSQHPWEYGSDFHYLHAVGVATPKLQPWGSDRAYLGTGRHALRLLIEHAVQTRAWKRLFVPSYFCDQVVRAVDGAAIEVLYYRSFADADWRSLRAGDAMIRVNLFGASAEAPQMEPLPEGVELIEDHTHDPWSGWAERSEADWCLASLRKSLPLPDGAVLWSPKRHRLPAAPIVTPGHRDVAAARLAAMHLKAEYLSGQHVRKDSFRELFVATEELFGQGRLSGMTAFSADLLEAFDVASWRAARSNNGIYLAQSLADASGVTVLSGARDAAPFAVVVSFASREIRERIRGALIARRIYPAVIWPQMPQAPHEAFSEVMLAFPCDARYGQADLDRVAIALREEAGRAYEEAGH